MRLTDKLLQTTIFLLLITLWSACNSDTENEIDQAIDPVELGDPALNQFIITAEDELVVRVDAATGEEQIVFAFAH